MFYHSEKGIRAEVRGDDFTVLGSRVELDWVREVNYSTSPVGKAQEQVAEENAGS